MSDDAAASEVPMGHRSRSGHPKRYFLVDVAIVLGVIGLLASLFMPAVSLPRGPARRVRCINNVRAITLAIMNYASQNHALPPAYTVDPAGRPLHSWRTLILPFLDGQALYETIDLSKPWNDPANAAAYAFEPPIYRCPQFRGPASFTTYLAIVAPGGCLRPDAPRKLDEITDDHGQTLMIIEAPRDQAVHWMSPMDAGDETVLGIGPNSKLDHGDVMLAGFVDGHVQALSREISAATRRALISIAGNDTPGEF